jgi:phage gp36-like protein
MAYVTAEIVGELIGEGLIEDLADLDEDGGDDSGVIAARIADAGALIDSYCAKRYVVPFASITDSPPTPGIIQLVAKKLTAAMLLQPRRELTKQRELYYDEAIRLLRKLRDGSMDVPGGQLLPAEQAGTGLAFDDVAPTFAGHGDDLTDRMSRF